MLAAVRKLVGAARGDRLDYEIPTLDRAAIERPVAAPRRLLETANQAHEATMASLAEADQGIVAAQAAFDAEASDSNVAALLEAKRARERCELFAQRSARAAQHAQAAVVTAEHARDAALLAHLEDRAKGATARLEALWLAKGKPALEAFAAFTTEMDAILSDARAATVEAVRLRGGVEHAEMLGLNALRSVVKAWIAGGIGADARLRVERLVD